MKALSFWIIICLPVLIFSQENRTLISGTVRSDTLHIENAHVINKTSNKGSITNKLGQFKISGKKGDTLIVSDIQYHGEIIVLSAQQIRVGYLDIQLEVLTNELEEIVLRQYANMAKELGLPNAGKKLLLRN